MAPRHLAGLALALLATGCLTQPTPTAAQDAPFDEDPTVPGFSLASDSPARDGAKTYVIASTQPGAEWADVSLTLDLAPLTRLDAGPCVVQPGQWAPCRDGAALSPTEPISRGDLITAAASPGSRLGIYYTPAGREVLHVTVS